MTLRVSPHRYNNSRCEIAKERTMQFLKESTVLNICQAQDTIHVNT